MNYPLFKYLDEVSGLSNKLNIIAKSNGYELIIYEYLPEIISTNFCFSLIFIKRVHPEASSCKSSENSLSTTFFVIRYLHINVRLFQRI